MFEYLNGIISDLGEDFAVVDINGVGFKCICSQNTIKSLTVGKVFKVYTIVGIRDDNIAVYGFSNKHEMSIFKLLNTVSGVGPKAALSLLSNLKVNELNMAIATKNYRELTKAPGIGKKTAERIILELKDKLSYDDGLKFASMTTDDNTVQVIQALTSLGYSYGEASSALSKIENKDKAIDILIKEALKQLSRI
ncbi:MAG: Holliday junction branch migration protein RuvA [Clostridiales bacterium]|nr:Holliday junction branch migration protein RuvA [Clostridiales bacterium]